MLFTWQRFDRRVILFGVLTVHEVFRIKTTEQAFSNTHKKREPGVTAAVTQVVNTHPTPHPQLDATLRTWIAGDSGS